jgi:4-aminobutyrate aminotransferase-like enzyme
MVKSAFQYMYDAEGNTFLDAYNNIPHVGHSHPKVVEAAQRQLAKLNTNTRYIYDELADYAEKLLKHFPSQLNKVFFVNSGSAASDLAVRMANNHTKSNTMMVMESGYHGNTQIAIDISDYKFNNPKGDGQKNHIIKTILPDTYRGKYTADITNAGTLFGKDAVAQIEQSKQPISAFISEPILGCAGQVPLADGYLKEVYPAIRAQGGICISDEVQTGFGRLGDHFWGYEAYGVIPDMVILGKPIANGHPMGAVVCTLEIAESFEKGVEFFSSFGGNPVSCAIASAVLDVIEEEKLQENAKVVGDYYMSLLKDMMKKYSCIGDVRGSGLFIGFDIVEDNSKTPNTALASHIKNELRNKHILVSTDGPYDNVIKTKPPLCFSKKNAETVVTTVSDILATYNNNNGAISYD